MRAVRLVQEDIITNTVKSIFEEMPQNKNEEQVAPKTDFKEESAIQPLAKPQAISLSDDSTDLTSMSDSASDYEGGDRNKDFHF